MLMMQKAGGDPYPADLQTHYETIGEELHSLQMRDDEHCPSVSSNLSEEDFVRLGWSSQDARRLEFLSSRIRELFEDLSNCMDRLEGAFSVKLIEVDRMYDNPEEVFCE